MTPGPARIYLDAGAYQPLGVDPNAMVTLSYAQSNAPTLYDCNGSPSRCRSQPMFSVRFDRDWS